MNKVGFIVAVMLSTATVSVAGAQTYTPGNKVNKDFASFAQSFLATHCIDCHGETEPEGNLSLQDLGSVDELNAGIWKSVWAQVTLKEMPPRDADQPQVVERLQFSDWIVAELTSVMRDKGGFLALLDPNKGNFVDHDLLFGPLPNGIELAPTSSPARLWRVTPQEHITRLNELINTEPNYDPEKPGLRTHGDAVPVNHGGELKLYFGIDNLIKWQGGSVAYGTAVKNVPGVLASAGKHGLQNYPHFYSVNSAEATQIMDMANDILRYMAYGPLSIATPEQITDDPSAYYQFRTQLRLNPKEGQVLGGSLVYSTKVLHPLTPVHDLMKEEGFTDKQLRAAVDYLFEALTFRPPTQPESDNYLAIVKQSVEKLGKQDGAVLGLSAIFLDRDALFRPELAESSKPDQHGRVMLQDWELGLAVNHALRYIKPDEALKKVIQEGRMRTRDDVRREVGRMLADDSIRKPRILQFFRDYFGYDLAAYICKDNQALEETGVRTDAHYFVMLNAAASTDRLVELILQEDKDVLRQLLTTDKIVVAPQVTENRDTRSTPEDRVYFGERLSDEEARSDNRNVVPANLSGPRTYARVSRPTFAEGSLRPERILATVPAGQRLGILTHPSWLVSHSDAMDNHAIHRGKWIRERLLGGGIPDVPITVDAMLPEEPHNTLRERMRVTKQDYCWTCHEKMDPLGLPFEMYNHAGLFRSTELGKPVDTTGEIIDSGDPSLDGKVADAIEMIQKIAKSQRAEQVFVRHAFRFWMGRNETLNDAPVLQAAYHAYKDGGGSMKALLASLLTSDAFLYRTRDELTWTESK